MTDFYKYLKQQRLEIGKRLDGKVIIYLDINFWIRLRNARQKQPSADLAFYDRVLELWAENKCVFPISEMTYWEIMKQSDRTSRNATIELIDQLSSGVAIVNMQERAALETRTWLLKARGKPVYETKELIWTNLAFAIGYEHILMLPTLDLQIKAINNIGAKSLIELTEKITKVFSYKDNVSLYNESSKAFAHQYKTQEELLAIEIDGIVDSNRENILDAFDSMKFSETGSYLTELERSNAKIPELVAGALKTGHARSELPIFFIIAALHAWTRWKQKPFKDGNDTIDFYHATFALPYADYFFTDRRLANAIKESKLDKLYNCTVEYYAINVLKSLTSIV